MKPITAEVLRTAYPYASAKRIALLLPGIVATMAKHEIDQTMLRAAHFLAQVGHESGSLKYMEEIASGAAYEGRANLGNTVRGDGKRFKGRGLIQLTGRANYRQFAADMDRDDVMDRPSLVATDPLLCCEVAGWYWNRHGLNALADKDQLTAITRAINGGLNGFDDRLALLRTAKIAIRRYCAEEK
jgi:putative chitinase